MSRLFFLLYALIGPSLAGVGVVIVLTMGLDTLRPILTSAAVGFALGVPAAWIVMRQLAGGPGS
ncbi:CTP synthetase [Rhodobacter sp. HX-7-19]|uniref:CTP synthetase n=2 Tax=Paragemmobacter kunshanensis TaxID=2583234 RepID=A0A6M1U7Y0_9RHOB|nr:CTP synthetase [Rhodobacter kunshanensis]